ncbi:MAG: ArsR family transcriptional regulator [Bacteroidetes bacterium]|nr:ArsR family transcriptional regulator [Bacteroidota bacterium]
MTEKAKLYPTMLDTLITSKTRIKLLTKFFLNPQAKAYLRGLEETFGESSNAVRIELNRFEHAGLLNSAMEGNRKVYTANTNHPLYPDIHNILRKHLGIDHIIEEVTKKLGRVEQVWLSGEFAKGNDSSSIELLLVGIAIDQEYLKKLNDKASSLISRTIKLNLFTPDTFADFKKKIKATDIFLLWESKSNNNS